MSWKSTPERLRVAQCFADLSTSLYGATGHTYPLEIIIPAALGVSLGLLPGNEAFVEGKIKLIVHEP